ncbi:putative Insect cuticle protein domain-containing protein 20 [Homarus americanus]|uniref:Putative Insect cuticle protein domain-containing protein 20 n=1 Tax=Homarus americanus TaxID=6706 RepID=A0A8J5MWU0_HOMAM|nr:putative Insect cuticle protein domain-containing protein 20 [Homarus americanus]
MRRENTVEDKEEEEEGVQENEEEKQEEAEDEAGKAKATDFIMTVQIRVEGTLSPRHTTTSCQLPLHDSCDIRGQSQGFISSHDHDRLLLGLVVEEVTPVGSGQIPQRSRASVATMQRCFLLLGHSTSGYYTSLQQTSELAIMKVLVILAVTTAVLASPTPQQPETQQHALPYYYYYEVLDLPTRNFQRKFEMKLVTGDVLGLYWYLAPDDHIHATRYSVRGDSGFMTRRRKIPVELIAT